MKTRLVVAAFAALALIGVVGVLVRPSSADGLWSARVPSVTTGAASGVTGTSATLHGTVNPRHSATTAHFDWGKSAAYGSSTPRQLVGSGRSAVALSTTLRGLTASTTYHFRLVATNARGTSYSPDRVFMTSAGPSPTPTSTTSSPTSTGSVCTNPYFTTSDSNGGISDGGYYVHNNLWNAFGYPGTKVTTQVCSYRSWNHVGTATNTGDGAVKTYPNVHKDYSGRTISNFPTLTSNFAATSPGVGIYNVAYDLWLNGVPNDEVMIWTDNHGQVPAGSRFASGVNLSGRTWDVYATGGNGYLAFVPANGAHYTSGTLDLKAMLNYLVAQGRVAATSTVDQVCYGVEIVDTGGGPATWNFTDFSITDS